MRDKRKPNTPALETYKSCVKTRMRAPRRNIILAGGRGWRRIKGTEKKIQLTVEGVGFFPPLQMCSCSFHCEHRDILSAFMEVKSRQGFISYVYANRNKSWQSSEQVCSYSRPRLGNFTGHIPVVLVEQIQFEIYFGLIDLKASSLLLQHCRSIAVPRAA